MATIDTILAFSSSSSVITTAVVVATLLFIYFNWRNAQPHNWPLIGMLPMLLPTSAIFDSVTAFIELSGGTFVFKGPWFCNRDMIVTADPANVQHVLSTKFSKYPKGPDTKRIFSAYGEMLFAADLDDWRWQRKLVHAFFHCQRLQLLTVNVNQEILEKGLIPVLDHASEHGITIDLQDVFQRFMLDATFMMISGKNHGSLRIGLPKDAVLEALHDASDAILLRHILPEKLWAFQSWLGVGIEKSLSKACKVLDDAAAEYIKTWKEQTSNIFTSKDIGEESPDAITFFYREKEILESIGELDCVMREIVKAFIFGGTDTTSPVLPWFFWLLSKNPNVESKIRKELAESFGATKSSTRLFFDPKQLSRLVYLQAAMCETLRLFPAVPFQPRTSTQADLLPSGHHVKPKTRVVLCTYAMGRMKWIWGEDCPEFKPERWISERGGLKPMSSNKFMAFSSGPRICLGKELAFVRLKAIAATVLFNYEIHVAEDQPAPTPSTSIILHMKHGLMAKILKRSTT